MAITLLVSLVIFALAILLSVRFIRPTYRIGASNILTLLDAVLLGQAKHQDWLVFTAVPIRYNPALDAIRLRCVEIEERHLLGDASRFLFDHEGLEQIRSVKSDLQALVIDSRL